ncbi:MULTISPECIES: DUF1998 domain-containing protein [Myxococcus]|uniref:DUF1998 domain-containing protein n=1 Tax=Myxococcus TaxID=32 RepID=UPI0013902896|nr:MULTISPECIES: DUF1998 domain-containing protein [Myxococcus]NOK01001.1 DUF1998 domain-containing protein [Myxococcus xanthus]
MSDYVRRAQLITPSGVGAITVIKGGTSVICAGIDHWFERSDSVDPKEGVDATEFEVDEPRLRKLLSVERLYTPPDYRPYQAGSENRNVGLKVHFLRFPRWHVCNDCGEMVEVSMAAKGTQYCAGRCRQERGRARRIFQVRFAAMCEGGHLQDFPWREWVHRDVSPTCEGKLRMTGGAGASLAAITVECACGRKRNLSDTMDAETGEEGQTVTALTRKLDASGALYLCTGQRPWLGAGAAENCKRHLQGTLLNASNLYFASIASAIYLPPAASETAPAELVDFLSSPVRATAITTLRSFDALNVQTLRKKWDKELARYSDEQINAALSSDDGSEQAKAEDTDDPVMFRREEFEVLSAPQDREQLRVKVVPASEYTEPLLGQPFSRFFSSVSLIDRLRETRALYGFTRVKPGNNTLSRQQQKAQLRRRPLPPSEEWLPAYTVFGEGIFLSLNEELLQKWERKEDAAHRRANRLGKAYGALAERGWGGQTQLSARFLLVHTFAHLLMNRLTFECGYSSASLKERLYVSSNETARMAGLLIYTAAGDADGTMGGLVRMGKPGRLEAVIRRALEGADWCSADPVCMEMGEAGGQGPDSCNLAACHACGLVPETACEQFNRFLDRGLVVGVPSQRDIGFFWGT